MSAIAVVGAGYVGLTTAACLAHLGHEVRCSDCDADRIAHLRSGQVPVFEEGLSDLVHEGLRSGRLAFGASNAWAVEAAELCFLCVPTIDGPGGRPDISPLEDVAKGIGKHLESGTVVAIKSTVPIGSTPLVQQAVGRDDVTVVSNPEFLREGSAVHDFLHPDRIVIGADDEDGALRVAVAFSCFGAPVILTSSATAETIKYAANAFLATKMSFVSAIAALCEGVGADVRQVLSGMGHDPRIGSSYMSPGPGSGGSCLPKDTAALVQLAADAGYDFSLLRAVMAVNEQQCDRVVQKAVRLAGGVEGARVAIWGATFKARTNDLRSSPAIEIGRRLAGLGARVAIYDPTLRRGLEGFEVVVDAYAAATGAVVAVLATEWEEFRFLDFVKLAELMERPAIVDARNLLEPAAIRGAGFLYEGIGVL